MAQRVLIALGSNLGNRKENLITARRLLQGFSQELIASGIYETSPYIDVHQPRFLNQTCSLLTTLSPYDFLLQCQNIESQMGRVRSPEKRFGPRVIDIDILFYNKDIISSSQLTIPHPGISCRPFVLIPLNEIAGGFEHPVSRMPVWKLAEPWLKTADVWIFSDEKEL